MSINTPDLRNQAEALRYAAIGWRVYPCWGIQDGKCLCGGRDGCHPGKHPYGRYVPHGADDATSNADTIGQWFKGSGVNVGVAVDDFVVVEADVKSGGMETLMEWERIHGAMPITPAVKSGGGGRHFYFKPSEPIDLPNGYHIAEGVEYHFKGGMIVPPSKHHSGGEYEWLIAPDTPLAEIPDWLLAIITKADKKTEAANATFDPMCGVVASGETFAELEDLPSNERNQPINRTIGSMLAHGYTREQIMIQGTAWAERQNPPYDTTDLAEKVRAFAAKREVHIAEVGGELANGEKVFQTSISPFANSPFADTETINHTHPSTLYYGLLGEFVRAVEPHTEADPIGILMCLLVGVGNILGRSIYHRIGRRHSGNLFALLVGETTDRKGTCWDVAEELLSLSASDW